MEFYVTKQISEVFYYFYHAAELLGSISIVFAEDKSEGAHSETPAEQEDLNFVERIINDLSDSFQKLQSKEGASEAEQKFTPLQQISIDPSESDDASVEVFSIDQVAPEALLQEEARRNKIQSDLLIQSEEDEDAEDQLEINRVTVEGRNDTKFVFHVEMAITPFQREKGLMNRYTMPEDEGMMFVFNAIRPQSFWMKNTYIPLDIIFIGRDGRIDHIHHNAKPQDMAQITSPNPVKAVLEINGGMSDKLGIEEGNIIYHPIFNNINLLVHQKN